MSHLTFEWGHVRQKLVAVPLEELVAHEDQQKMREHHVSHATEERYRLFFGPLCKVMIREMRAVLGVFLQVLRVDEIGFQRLHRRWEITWSMDSYEEAR